LKEAQLSRDTSRTQISTSVTFPSKMQIEPPVTRSRKKSGAVRAPLRWQRRGNSTTM